MIGGLVLAAASSDPGPPGSSPTIIPVLVVAALVLGLCFLLLVGLARSRGPEPGEVAIAYELAWDRFEFDILWDLSGPMMRDGRTKAGFVADKRQAYAGHPELRGLVQEVRVMSVEVEDERATVTTVLDLHEGGSIADELLMRRSDATWRVEAYRLDRPAGVLAVTRYLDDDPDAGSR